MDWMLFWTAAGVVVSLGTLFLGCFMSLARQIAGLNVRVDNLDKSVCILNGKVDIIDQRLSKLEGGFEERGRWESRSK